jgi:hypothetical protein
LQVGSRVSAQRVALSKAHQDADPQHPVEVLRKRRKRPRRRAAEECDELAPLMCSPQAEDRTLPQDHTYHTVEEAVLCIAAFWKARITAPQHCCPLSPQ